MITTGVTARFGLSVPVLLAPMDAFADARLACAVTAAGGLGMLGAGYRDADWLTTQFAATAGTRVGVGFIAWRLAQQPELLDVVLDRDPAALMLSFGDPTPFADRIHAANVPLINQINDREEARRALDIGAQVLVAQGAEAGGHGKGVRSTFTLVPEIADLIAVRAPGALLLAAGGIADGRGLAAALSLGADGVLVGSRLWATQESPAAPAACERVLAAGSDDTVRCSVFDIVRGYPWPPGYTGRVLRNDLVGRWSDDEAGLRANLAAVQRDYRAAVEASDYGTAAIHISEAVGIIGDRPTVAEVLNRMAHDAAAILRGPAGA